MKGRTLGAILPGDGFPLIMAAVIDVQQLRVVLDGRVVIEDLSFRLDQGENLAIIGPNGAGKTVLLRALLGLVPYSGRIVWAPDVKLGYVPQKIDADRHLPMSAGDLLAAKLRILGLPEDGAAEALEIVGLPPETLRRPIGLLSGGQFQKALIAFALLGRPNLMLFDEPTASLDAPAEEHIYSLIQRLQEQFGITVIVVSHDLSMVYRFATQVLCLNRQGACFGSPHEILTPDSLERLYGAPYRFYHHEHTP